MFLSSWLNRVGAKSKRGPTFRRRAPGFRPCLELLEERLVLHTFNLTLDPGLYPADAVHELAGYISIANSITDQPTTLNLVAGATYDLTAINNYWYGPDGLPAISSNVTINGNGATIQRDAAAPHFRLFYISGGIDGLAAGNLTLQDLTLTGGFAAGGNGSNGGGGGAGLGGAIFNQGTLNLSGVTLMGNEALGGGELGSNVISYGGGGGLGSNGFPSGDGGGFGGLFPGGNGGKAVSYLTGINEGGGGGFGSDDIATSEAGAGHGGFGGSGGGNGYPGGDGGGAGGGPGSPGAGGDFGFGAGGIEFHAEGGGGGGGVGGGGGGSGASGGGGGGGGGAGDAGNGFGGGNGGFGGGGGIGGIGGFGGGNGSTGFGQNSAGGGAGFGGAIFNMFGTVTLVNSTLYGNTAQGGTPGSPAQSGVGAGGGIFNLDGTVNVFSSTIANNFVGGNTIGGGILYSMALGKTLDGLTIQSATVNAANSIFAGSSNVRIKDGLGTLANSSIFNGLGPNIFEALLNSDSMPQGTPVTVVPSAMLGTLGPNGGRTETIPLLPGSPAIDHGDNSAPAADQRGVLRDALPDIGAYEYLPPPPSTTLVINEIDYDQPGTDTAEFIEIKNISNAALDLDPYQIVLVNGSDGSTYQTVDLPAFSLASGAYYVVSTNASLVPNTNQLFSVSSNAIQNGSPDAVALILTTDMSIVDALSYEGSVAGYTEGAGTTAADDNVTPLLGLSRIPDGVDSSHNSTDFVLATITPGAANNFTGTFNFVDTFNRPDSPSLGPDYQQTAPLPPPLRFTHRRQLGFGGFQLQGSGAVSLGTFAVEQVAGQSLLNPTSQAIVDASNSQALAVGLAARIQSDGRAYVGALTNTGMVEILLINAVQKTSSVLASTSAPGGLTTGTLQFVVMGGATPTLTLSLNGTPLVRVTPSSGDIIAASGGAGLFALGAGGVLDNFSLSGL